MKKLFLYLFVLWLLLACNGDTGKKVLRVVKQNYPDLPLNKPVLNQVVENASQLQNSKTYFFSDSIEGKNIKMRIDHLMESDSVVLVSYEQYWLDRWYFHTLSIKHDTMYWLLHTVGNDEIYFLQGEYEYRRWNSLPNHERMSKDEAIYYDLYQDSLRKVKGNKLPHLPAPTAAEIELWKKKFPERELP